MDPTDRDDELDWTLLARYFAGELSPAERAAVERWAGGAPGRAEELRRLRVWWERAAVVPSARRVDAMWGALSRRMASAGEAPAASRPTRPASVDRARRGPTPVFALGARRSAGSPAVPARRVGWRRSAGAIAAGLMIAAGGTLSWRAWHHAAPVARAETPPREFTTGRGQRATVQLLDGTRVELGFASRLRVQSFERGRREMDLEGEAIFHVVHDAARPFVVHAANATTEDLGTVFGVRAYPGTGAVSVLVVSGKVALRPRARAGASAPAEGGVGAAVAAGAVLGRGQLGRLDASGHVDVTSGADTAAFLAWLSDRVVFRNATLADVAADVGRRFDVDVRIPDPAVASRRVTVDVAAHSLTDVLDAVTVPLGLHHRRARGTIVLGR